VLYNEFIGQTANKEFLKQPLRIKLFARKKRYFYQITNYQMLYSQNLILFQSHKT